MPEDIYAKFIPAGRVVALEDASENWVNRVQPAGRIKLEGVSGAGGAVSITFIPTPEEMNLAISGDDNVMPAATGSAAGLMTAAQFIKLAGIEAGAEINDSASEILVKLLTVDDNTSGLNAQFLSGQSRAYYEGRANHTGSQAISTVAGLQSELDGKEIAANKGVANGYASLDSGGKIVESQLPSIAITDVYVVASEAAQLALTTDEGDVVVRTDTGTSYINNGGSAGDMTDWTELLSPGGGGSVTSVNGQTGTVTLTTAHITEGSNLYYTDERAQDAVGGILTDTATINFTYTDATPEVTADVIDDSITNAKLRNSTALSVIGRSANSSGDPADIAAANDGEILRRSGATIGFGTIATAGLADDAVTYAKMQNISATDRLLGRVSSGAGNTEEITCTAAGRALIDDANAAAQLTTLGINASPNTVALLFVIDGGGSAITTGAKVFLAVPFAATIASWRLIGSPSGSIVLDLWKANAALPTVANTITASAKPTLSSATHATSSSLTGWTTSVAAGDIIRVNVDSASTITLATLSLVLTKT